MRLAGAAAATVTAVAFGMGGFLAAVVLTKHQGKRITRVEQR